MIRNIKDIENIKINILDNTTKIFKSEENSEIDLKEIIKNNIELNYKLAEKLGIDIEK
jgi:hypothetical protein